MADAAIQELEDAATEYAQTRDERQTLLAQEVDLKATLLTLMKKHKKEHYEHNGVIVDVVHEEETVKVKLSKKKESEEEAA